MKELKLTSFRIKFAFPYIHIFCIDVESGNDILIRIPELTIFKLLAFSGSISLIILIVLKLLL